MVLGDMQGVKMRDKLWVILRYFIMVVDTDKSDNVVVKSKIVSRGYGKKQIFNSLALGWGLRVMDIGSKGWVVGSRFDGSV